MNITFIGNCQTVGLCFFLQELLKLKNYNICWCLYGEEFNQHLGKWSEKCKNKILDYDNIIKQIKDSDVIIYQEISINKSLFCYGKKLEELKKDSCRLIKMPCMYFIYDNYDDSMVNLKYRENMHNVDIKVSDIINKFKDINLMATINHPKTFLFLEVIKELTNNYLNVDFFTEEEYNNFLKNENLIFNV